VELRSSRERWGRSDDFFQSLLLLSLARGSISSREKKKKRKYTDTTDMPEKAGFLINHFLRAAADWQTGRHKKKQGFWQSFSVICGVVSCFEIVLYQYN